MKVYRLSVPGIISPFWLTSVRYDRHRVQVGDAGDVELMGQRLTFSSEALPAGAALVVWMGHDGFLRAASAAEYDADQQSRAAAEAAEAARVQADEQRQRDEARAFNASLSIPVAWATGIKDVLSGLSESSMGNGFKRNTVVHVVLLDDLKAGRLVRQAGDFLCTSNSSANGKRWSGDPRLDQLPGQESAHAVTCSQCLRLAKRVR